MSRALPERRVARCERSEEMSLNMAAHVGVFAPRRKCCEPFAINFGVTDVFRAADGAADMVSRAIRFFPCAIFALGCPTCAAESRGQNNPGKGRNRMKDMALRSEEHTSELQSLMRISYAVFCLKKKNNTY